MRIDTVSVLSSNSTFLTDLKRIQTPHTLFWDFGADKTFTTSWSGCRVQVWVHCQVWALKSSGKHSRRLFQKTIESFDCKINGQCSCTAWALRTGKIKHRAFPSWLQSLLAATGLLKGNMLPLLQYWLSSRVKEVLMLWRYRAATSHFLFHVKWNFRWNWQELVADQNSTHCLAQSFDHSLSLVSE